MRRLGAMLAAILFMLTVAGCRQVEQENDPPDLQAYIDHVRRSGMSDRARMSLYSVAAVMTGQSSLTYVKDEASGQYWPSWHSNTCALPGVSNEERQRLNRLYQAANDSTVAAWKPLADADGSGFVTDEEGRRFRDLHDFGHKVEYLLNEVGLNPADVADLCNQSKDEFREDVAAFNGLMTRAAERGLAGYPSIVLFFDN